MGLNHESINVANTVEIEFSRVRTDGYENVIKHLRKWGFDVIRLDFMELQGVRGIAGAIITLESYENSVFGSASKVNKEHHNQSVVRLEDGMHVINPYYHNPKLTLLLRKDWQEGDNIS